MSLTAECPVCRRPLRWTYVLRHGWSQWRCRYCGSLLEIDRKRRFLAAIPFCVVILASAFLASRIGLSDYSALFVALGVWLPAFLLIDRAVAIERCGFRCKTCGYDLQGQVAPRCPECGRDFDAEERAVLETGALPKSEPSRRRGFWIGVVVIGLLLMSTLWTGFLYYRQATTAPGVPVATQPAASQPVSAMPASVQDGGPSADD